MNPPAGDSTTQSLLDENKRRLVAAAAKPSLLRRKTTGSGTDGPTGAVDGGETGVAVAETPTPSSSAGSSSSSFMLSKIACFGVAMEEPLREDTRGTMAQYRSPAFATAQAISKCLHTITPPSAATVTDSGSQMMEMEEDKGATNCGTMVVDVLEATLSGQMSQAPGAGSVLFHQPVHIQVVKAVIKKFGIAFGTVIAYPYSEAIRVQLHDLCGGTTVLARCFDTEPLRNGEEVLLTIEPGCIRAHCARPKRAQGHWKLVPGDLVAEETKTTEVDRQEDHQEGGEGGVEGGEGVTASPSPKKKGRRFGKRARHGDQPIADELVFVPFTPEERLAELEKRKRDREKREQEEAFSSQQQPESQPETSLKSAVAVVGFEEHLNKKKASRVVLDEDDDDDDDDGDANEGEEPVGLGGTGNTTGGSSEGSNSTGDQDDVDSSDGSD